MEGLKQELCIILLLIEFPQCVTERAPPPGLLTDADICIKQQKIIQLAIVL